MNERVMQDAGGECPREIVGLLPWYLNGTLEVDEQRQVEAHAAGCARCQQEIRQWQALQAAVREMGNAVPAPVGAGFPLLRRRIEQEREPVVNWSERLQAWLDGLFARRPVPTLALAVVTVQFLLVVGLIGLLLEQRNEIQTLYQTLSGPPVKTFSPGRLTVAFHEQATEVEIRNLLHQVQGTIVEGPSALGLYTVAVSVEGDPEQQVERTLQELQRYPRVVKFAERAMP